MTDDLLATVKRLVAVVERLEARSARGLLTVAQIIGPDHLNVSLDWWRHNNRRLREKFGFPNHVEGMPSRWDPHAVEAWLDGMIPPEYRVTLGAEPQLDTEIDRRLEEKGRALAQRATQH